MACETEAYDGSCGGCGCDRPQHPGMRTFDTGATRNVEVDPDYHGFLSPLALHAYGEYMHRHRLQADGTMRDSDNWQKGIPNDAFVRSLVRHVHDIQLVLDGYGELARQDDRDDNVLLAHLSAALFNVQGLLHNVMLEVLAEEHRQDDEPYSDYMELLHRIPNRGDFMGNPT